MRDKNRPNDLITINTGYGPLAVKKRILDHWCRYGWPSNETLKAMTKAGTTEFPDEREEQE